MTKFLALLIIAVFAFAVPAVYADTDSGGVRIEGDSYIAMTITNADLSYVDDGSAGTDVAELIGTTSIELEDNDVSAVNMDDILQLQIADAELPSQYPVAYRLVVGATSWTPAADDEFDGVVTGPGGDWDVWDAQYDYMVLEFTGSVPEQGILHGTAELPIKILKQTGERIAGNTADTINLQYTFIDN